MAMVYFSWSNTTHLETIEPSFEHLTPYLIIDLRNSSTPSKTKRRQKQKTKDLILEITGALDFASLRWSSSRKKESCYMMKTDKGGQSFDKKNSIKAKKFQQLPRPSWTPILILTSTVNLEEKERSRRLSSGVDSGAVNTNMYDQKNHSVSPDISISWKRVREIGGEGKRESTLRH